MASTILSDNGVSSGSAGIKTTADSTGALALQTTTAGGTATTAVTIDTSQNVGIGTSSPSKQLEVNKTGKFGLGNAIGTAAIQFTHSDASALVWQLNSGISGVTHTAMSIGTVASPSMVNIDSSGNLLVGTTTKVNGAFVSFSTGIGAGTILGVNNSSNVNYAPIVFQTGGTNVGYISCTTSATAYITSSDYRLKENIAPMTGALEKVAQLKPCTYSWKATGEEAEGFIAHELAEVCPQAVAGEKDAVDADGNPVYQGIDTSFLVATLTAAIKEQQALITSLTERITALEGAQQ